MTESDHRKVETVMSTLSPHMLSVLARKDNSAAIRNHARRALIDRIAAEYGVLAADTEVVRV